MAIDVLIVDETNSRAMTAEKRYGKYASPHEIAGVLQEEFTEAIEALHKNDWTAFRDELMDIAAVCLRGASETTIREEKNQV